MGRYSELSLTLEKWRRQISPPYRLKRKFAFLFAGFRSVAYLHVGGKGNIYFLFKKILEKLREQSKTVTKCRISKKKSDYTYISVEVTCGN